MIPAKQSVSRVREWRERKARQADDPLFSGGTAAEAELTGAVVAAAAVGGKVVARTASALLTNSGRRVWFPVQHVNPAHLTPSAKRWV